MRRERTIAIRHRRCRNPYCLRELLPGKNALGLCLSCHHGMWDLFTKGLMTKEQAEAAGLITTKVTVKEWALEALQKFLEQAEKEKALK